MALTKNTKITEATELFLPAGAVFRGDFETDGNARIEGTIIGNVNVKSGDILFGVKSKVDGDVCAINITTGGIINGNITSGGLFEVQSGASIIGDVVANAMIVEENAHYQGNVQIGIKDAKLLSSKQQLLESDKLDY